jgi:hypothetical protein
MAASDETAGSLRRMEALKPQEPTSEPDDLGAKRIIP